MFGMSDLNLCENAILSLTDGSVLVLSILLVLPGLNRTKHNRNCIYNNTKKSSGLQANAKDNDPVGSQSGEGSGKIDLERNRERRSDHESNGTDPTRDRIQHSPTRCQARS
ncbi:uncharacterized protein UDID_18021 [Ustilago sp. UG-2017a]|nr:uncharacterized protein UDID_18021 [Ustilago sp. UG-2017a]